MLNVAELMHLPWYNDHTEQTEHFILDEWLTHFSVCFESDDDDDDDGQKVKFRFR